MNWDGLKKILESRKFLLVVAFAVVAALRKVLGIEPEQLREMLYAVLAVIGAEGVADIVSRARTNKTTLPPAPPEVGE